MSILHNSVRNESIEDVKNALISGIDINQTDNHNRTALHLAAWKSNIDILNILLDNNVNMNAKAMDNFTALHFAAQNPNGSEFIKILIKNNKKLLNERIKKDNKSALHLAVAKGNKDVVRCLISLGADILAKTNSGKSPYDFIKYDDNEMKEILQLALSERKSKIEKPNNNNNNNSSSSSSGGSSISNNNNNVSELVHNNSKLPIIPNEARIHLDDDDDDDEEEDNNNNNNNNDIEVNLNINSKRLRETNEDTNEDTNEERQEEGEEKITVKTGIMKKNNNKRKIILSHLERDDEDD